jgi:predicted RNA-binding protein with EMAP domain|tara:strand:+ start:739 stop:966 length:228 start_codon:yes stop_codon:yes gene_type:complete
MTKEKNHLEQFLEKEKDLILKTMNTNDPMEKAVLAIDQAIRLEMSKGFNPNTDKIKVTVEDQNGNLVINAVKVKK